VTDKAPIVFAAVRGVRLGGKGALLFYMDIAVGDGVILIREPDNHVDGNAVKVHEGEYEAHIGYVQRDKAAILAKFMDAGWIYLARVVKRAKRKRMPKDVIGVVDGTLRIKCTPLEPPMASAKRKAARPVKLNVDNINRAWDMIRDSRTKETTK
jgi:hypothetical protein